MCTYYIVLDLLEWFPPKRNPNTAFKTMHMYLTGGLNAGNGNEAVLYYYVPIYQVEGTYYTYFSDVCQQVLEICTLFRNTKVYA